MKESLLEEMTITVEKLKLQRDEGILSIDRLTEEINQIKLKNQIKEESYNVEIDSLKTEIKFYLDKKRKAESNDKSSINEQNSVEDEEIDQCEEDEDDDYSRNSIPCLNHNPQLYSSKNKNQKNIAKEIESIKRAMEQCNKRG